MSSINTWGIGSDQSMNATPMTGKIVYTIKPGFINLNTRSGFVKISYDSIPVDQHGYPLIPDRCIILRGYILVYSYEDDIL